MKLVYTKEAVADLQRLRGFLAQKNPSAAARAAPEILSPMEKLSQFPQMGRPVEKAPDPATLRDLFFGTYHVSYSIHKETVIILRLWHTREDSPT